MFKGARVRDKGGIKSGPPAECEVADAFTGGVERWNKEVVGGRWSSLFCRDAKLPIKYSGPACRAAAMKRRSNQRCRRRRRCHHRRHRRGYFTRLFRRFNGDERALERGRDRERESARASKVGRRVERRGQKLESRSVSGRACLHGTSTGCSIVNASGG